MEISEKRLENPNDIEVLKVLFMLKNVKEMEPTLERIATLMVSDIHEDKKVLKDRIKEYFRNNERIGFLGWHYTGFKTPWNLSIKKD